MLTKDSPLGPNVRNLIIERTAQLQVEDAKARYGNAGVGEIAAAMAAGGGVGIQEMLRRAFEWTATTLDILRRAPGSEQWPTDEDMAGEILRRIAEKCNPGSSGV